MHQLLDKMKYNHLILDIELKNKISVNQINIVFQKIVNLLNLSVLKQEKHVFNNGWFTLFYILAESHISAHYRIEDSYLALDIYSCRNLENYEKQIIEIIWNLWKIKLIRLQRNL